MLLLYGTRPEAIKMSPVVDALRARPDAFDLVVCATGQHREMLDQVERLLPLSPDIDLDLMAPNQQLSHLASRVLQQVDRVLEEVAPDWLLVQGDTTTAMAASIAAFHRGTRLGHVEAGLRTGDLGRPFPEEANRRIIDVVADAMFAPTERARDTLIGEHAAKERVHLTGNTVVDALHKVAAAVETASRLDEVLVTIHRRESFGEPLRGMLAGVADLASRFPDLRWRLPVHPNPNVRQAVREVLGTHGNVQLTGPLGYGDLVECLMRARLVLTDSGGIQEEAPTFGTPVLVLRERTERPEGIDAGVARLVGVSRDAIVDAATELLTDDAAHRAMARAWNPYGDGHAADRIVSILAEEPWTPFVPDTPPP